MTSLLSHRSHPTSYSGEGFKKGRQYLKSFPKGINPMAACLPSGGSKNGLIREFSSYKYSLPNYIYITVIIILIKLARD